MKNIVSRLIGGGKRHGSFTNEHEKTMSSSTMTTTTKFVESGDATSIPPEKHVYVSLDGDGDVWVEQQIKNRKGRRNKTSSYFRSVQTDDCVWNEPPSGASYVVMQTELEQYPFLEEFASGKLGKPISTIEKEATRNTSQAEKKRGGIFT